MSFLGVIEFSRIAPGHVASSRSATAIGVSGMEKHSGTCRLILCCCSPGRVIEPVRSRCLGIRVPLPSTSEVVSMLGRIAKKEQITLPSEFAARIAAASGCNARKAVLMLEACRVASVSQFHTCFAFSSAC